MNQGGSHSSLELFSQMSAVLGRQNCLNLHLIQVWKITGAIGRTTPMKTCPKNQIMPLTSEPQRGLKERSVSRPIQSLMCLLRVLTGIQVFNYCQLFRVVCLNLGNWNHQLISHKLPNSNQIVRTISLLQVTSISTFKLDILEVQNVWLKAVTAIYRLIQVQTEQMEHR